MLAPSGTAGDALDNAFFVLGLEGSQTYLQKLSATEVFFFLSAPPLSRRKAHLRAGRWCLTAYYN